MADELRRTAEILAVPADQVVPAAERLVAEWKEFRKLSQRATEEQATAKTREELATAKGAWPIIKDEVSQGVGFMMSMSKATASESRATGIYWAAAPNDVKLVVTRGAEVPIDAAELIQAVAPEFRGKGGGRPDFAQASFPNLDQARAAAMKLEELVRKKLGIASG
jgi:alanyl-tRNA synthetase